MPRIVVLAVGLVVACSSPPAPDRAVEAPGPHLVGTRTTTLTDAARARALDVQLWFPTETAEAEVPFAALEVEARRQPYAELLAAAPGCPTRAVRVARDAAPLAGDFPVIVASHCHSCTRLANATVALRLASHGFVVVTVDHAGDTLWDHLAGAEGELSSAALETRAADVRFVIDALPMLVGAAPARLGVFGHSFGAVTAGRVAQLDARVTAAAALCAPMENPLIPGVTLAEIAKPLMFMVAGEDNSITELGNTLLRANFEDAPAAAWKVELPDAGHWSVSDVNGLVDLFDAGCGDGIRQTDDAAFTYLAPERGRALAAAYVTAFFAATLEGDAGAQAYLETAVADTTVDHR